MDEILDEIERPISFSDQEIFTKIWLRPREVFTYLHDNEYSKYVSVLLVLAGIGRAIGRASVKGMGDDLSLGGVLVMCILMGGLLGWIWYYFYAGMLSWTGKWLGGKGDLDSLLRVTAYAMIPSILALVLLIPEIAFFGNEIFESEMELPEDDLLPMLVFYGIAVLEIILGLYSMLLLIIGISVVQEMTIGKSILNFFLPILMIMLPLALIGLGFYVFY